MGDETQRKQISLPRRAKNFPRFNLKLQQQRQRSRRHKMSVVVQLQQLHNGHIDLQTPNSILTGTNLKDLINTNTFALLTPALIQTQLIQLLPKCDQLNINGKLSLNSSALGNEFFTKACNDWKDRLGDGEFIPENQTRRKHESLKEQGKIDLWKAKHFENDWGDKLSECNVDQRTSGPDLSPVECTTPSRIGPIGCRVSARLQSRSIIQKLKSFDLSASLSPNTRGSRLANSSYESGVSDTGGREEKMLELEKKGNELKGGCVVTRKEGSVEALKVNKIRPHRVRTLRGSKNRSAAKTLFTTVLESPINTKKMSGDAVLSSLESLIEKGAKEDEKIMGDNIMLVSLNAEDQQARLTTDETSKESLNEGKTFCDNYNILTKTSPKYDDGKSYFKRLGASDASKNTNKKIKCAPDEKIIKNEVKFEEALPVTCSIIVTESAKEKLCELSSILPSSRQSVPATTPVKTPTQTRTLAQIKEQNKARRNAKLLANVVSNNIFTPLRTLQVSISDPKDISVPQKNTTPPCNLQERDEIVLPTTEELLYSNIVGKSENEDDKQEESLQLVFSSCDTNINSFVVNSKSSNLPLSLSNDDCNFKIEILSQMTTSEQLMSSKTIPEKTITTYRITSNQSNITPSKVFIPITLKESKSLDPKVLSSSNTSSFLCDYISNPVTLTTSQFVVSSMSINNSLSLVSSSVPTMLSSSSETDEHRVPIPKFRLLRVPAADGHCVYKLESVPKTSSMQTSFIENISEQENADLSKENNSNVISDRSGINIKPKLKWQDTFAGGRGVMSPLVDCMCNLRAMVECKGCGALCHQSCIVDFCVACIVPK